MKTRLNPAQLFIEILLVVGLAEVCVMLLLPVLAPGLDGWSEGLLDVAMLVLLSGPAVYWRVIAAVKKGAASSESTASIATQNLSLRKAIVLTACTQVAGLALTGTAVWFMKSNLDQVQSDRFSRGVERLEAEVQRRFELPVSGLKGARGALAAREGFNHKAFRDFMSTYHMSSDYPGILGMGFIERVPRGEVAAFTARERADGAPEFSVTTQGLTPDLLVIKYIEPLADNRAVWGYDIGQESERREAAERATISGLPTLTGPVDLVQDGGKVPGFLYFLPVYRNAMSPRLPNGQPALPIGFFFTPIIADELLKGIADGTEGLLDFQLLDGDGSREDRRFYGGDNFVQQGSVSVLTAQRAMRIGERLLTLRIRSTPLFAADQDRTGLALVGVGGTLISFLMAFAVWLLAVGRMRAQRLAQRMTADADRLARVVQHTGNAVTITDAQMRITWVNPAFTQVTGYTLAEALGRTPGELLGSGKSDPEAIRTLRESAARGEACSVQVLNRAKDGHEYWVDTEVQPTKDAAGTLIGFMEIGTDVTARKRDQQKLADMSDRMTLAIEGSSDGLWDWMDIHEDAQWWSPSYYTMLGFTPEEMPPSSGSYIKLLHPDSIAASLQAGRDAFEGVRPFEVEIQLRTKLQGYRWFRTRAKVYRDAKGNPVRMSGATQDVHERKLAEAQAQKAASILRNSIEALDDAFVLFDENDRLVMCNQRYREFYPESAVMMQPGNSFEDIVRYGAERGQYDAAVGRVDAWVADRLALHRQEHSRMQQSIHGGRTLRVVERRMPDGYTVGFRVDVSDLVKATEAAEDASRSKSQFLANMSHEIRTPMNAILGLLKLLQNTELTLRQQDYASKTEGAARSLLGLLNDILDFSKVEAGKMTLDPRPFRIDGLMRDLSVILSANVGEKDVEVLFDVDPALPKALIGDDMRLQQVLINLGGNAIKFTAQGVVVVRLRVLEQKPEGVSVEFSVSDSGIGIAVENQAQIFSGFSQAEANTTRRFGGTGLGLAISSRLTALMGGELKVESTLGVGSTFHFQIHMPVAPQIEPVSVIPVVSAPVGALRTLVVDDNPVALELLQQMVQSLGWPVDAAASGAQALAMVEKGLAEGAPYRAIFMDWQMPHMDGWRTSQRIRALTLEPPLIMMVTAHGREMLAQRSAADQAMLNGFLVKPVTASMLFDAIQDALQANALAATGHNPMAPQAVQKPQRLLGMRLLVVEDNKINQMVAQGLLSQEGASVTLADDGQCGVDAVANTQPGFDVVLMDLQMPVMDGYTATRAIRQQLGNNTLPIIAMTANAMASDRAACLAAGMNDHVGKPFELDHLVALLLRYSGRTTAQPASNGKPETPAANFTVSHAPGTLDMDAALNRLGGDTEILGQALQSYVQEIVTVSARVAGQLETGELQACARVLHTLKGLSATVGAIHLAQVAAQLESRCKTQLDVAERADVLSALQTAVQATVQSLEPVLTQYVTVHSVVTPENGENAAVLNEAAFRQDLQVLQGLLQNFDMLAQDAFARIRKDHGPALGDALEPLGTAIGLLAFEDAARISAEMLARGIG